MTGFHVFFRRMLDGQGWSLRTFAEHFGYSPTTIAHWRVGRANPSRKSIARLSRAINVSPLDLSVLAVTPADRADEALIERLLAEVRVEKDEK